MQVKIDTNFKCCKQCDFIEQHRIAIIDQCQAEQWLSVLLFLLTVSELISSPYGWWSQQSKDQYEDITFSFYFCRNGHGLLVDTMVTYCVCFCAAENKENACFPDTVIEMLNLKWFAKTLPLALRLASFIIISSPKVTNVLKLATFRDK